VLLLKENFSLGEYIMATNVEIVQRIRAARQLRNKTQQDLAAKLGKTAAAISDMERGKVHVSASDLSIISNILDMPIEYFFGEELGDQNINDIVTLLRKSSPVGRSKSLATVKMLMQMYQTGDILQLEPDREITPEEIGDFYKNFYTLTMQVKEMSAQLEEIQEKFKQEMKAQGISLPGLA
jgi:transcriptional regulator with XRE-family HTH domain